MPRLILALSSIISITPGLPSISTTFRYYHVQQVGKMQDDLRLTIELMPKTSLGKNLRNKTSKSNWDKIRKKAYSDHDHRCGICGSGGQMECHEIWEYDVEKNIQKLSGFIALCLSCHRVKHFSQSQIMARKGQLDIENVVDHFLKVNKCTLSGFKKHVNRAFEQWRERSAHSWEVDLGEYAKVFD